MVMLGQVGLYDLEGVSREDRTLSLVGLSHLYVKLSTSG